MTSLIIFLLVLWLVVTIVGALVEGLLWLLFIGLILFLVTAAYGWLKNRGRGGTATRR